MKDMKGMRGSRFTLAMVLKGNFLETGVTLWVKGDLSLSVPVCLCVLGVLAVPTAAFWFMRFMSFMVKLSLGPCCKCLSDPGRPGTVGTHAGGRIADAR